MMGPELILSAASLTVQSVVCLLLVIPVPSNSMRGAIVHGLNSLWAEHPALRGGAGLLCVVNVIALGFAVRKLSFPPEMMPPPPPPHELVHCPFALEQFRAERNALLSGFSLFVFLMMRRLLETQKQLYEAREAAKKQ